LKEVHTRTEDDLEDAAAAALFYYALIRIKQSSNALAKRTASFLTKEHAGQCHIKRLEKQGIDPCASCMLSMRSTI
jgi:hypothetical protein